MSAFPAAPVSASDTIQERFVRSARQGQRRPSPARTDMPPMRSAIREFKYEDEGPRFRLGHTSPLLVATFRFGAWKGAENATYNPYPRLNSASSGRMPIGPPFSTRASRNRPQVDPPAPLLRREHRSQRGNLIAAPPSASPDQIHPWTQLLLPSYVLPIVPRRPESRAPGGTHAQRNTRATWSVTAAPLPTRIGRAGRGWRCNS